MHNPTPLPSPGPSPNRPRRWGSVLLWLGVVGAVALLWRGSWQSSASASHPKTRYIQPPPSLVSEEPQDKRTRMFQGPLAGMAKHPWKLAQRLERAFSRKRKTYQPRTHHFWTNKLPRYNNRLLFETSPYLLQHAHNPVNWYPWGKAAFARAKAEKKPVLLSVGYSTCHWCHVMEKESFENPKIAAYMNKHYICIKVDREERLDVDGIYMRAVQIFSRGGGGWPMTVWLTPDRKPFYGGTYFPPRDRWGRKGFPTMLRLMAERYKRDPLGVARKSREMADRLQNIARLPPLPGVPTAQTLSKAAGLYSRYHDAVNGGMRGRPKFPSSMSVPFLLRYHRRTQDATSLTIARLTLSKMGYGGIYDQIGGGFHRYSVDAHWLVPHFEKMLYDNALLTVAYLEGFQVTKDPMFARIAKEVLAYVVRERTSPQGAFFSATDADSEGHEGKFFVWTPAQIDKALSPQAAIWCKAYYDVTPRGNFEGKNILHVKQPMAALAKRFKTSVAMFRTSIAHSSQILYKLRLKRIPPLSDEKIITSWNGLMISAFARASMVFGDKQYAERAAKAAAFLLQHMQRPDGRLFRTYMDGKAKFNAYLEDYAFLTAGLLDLFEATQDATWLQKALALQKVLQTYHWDPRGGYFRTSNDHEKLLFRPKPKYDGAVPTGNSIQAMNLMRLHTMTLQDKYRKWAEATFQYFGRRLKNSPIALSEMLQAVDFYHDAAKEIIIIKPDASASVAPFLAQLRQVFLPNRALMIATQGPAQARLQKLLPLLHKKTPLSGKVTAYVCQRRVCELPTTDPAIFAKQIRKVTPLLLPPRK